MPPAGPPNRPGLPGSTLSSPPEPSTADATSIAATHWVGWHTRFVLFTGTGGVGKTIAVSGAAVALADAGRRVLLVSTDPESNLGDVFQAVTGEEPTAAPDVAGLDLMDLDPHASADAYREPGHQALPRHPFPQRSHALEEQLAGACTVEVAAFDAFTRLLVDPATTERHNHVVLDNCAPGDLDHLHRSRRGAHPTGGDEEAVGQLVGRGVSAACTSHRRGRARHRGSPAQYRPLEGSNTARVVGLSNSGGRWSQRVRSSMSRVSPDTIQRIRVGSISIEPQ